MRLYDDCLQGWHTDNMEIKHLLMLTENQFFITFPADIVLNGCSFGDLFDEVIMRWKVPKQLASYKIVSQTERIVGAIALSICVVVPITGLLYLNIVDKSWLSRVSGIIGVVLSALNAFWGFDSLTRIFVVTSDGVYLAQRSRLRSEAKTIAWDEIERVVVFNTRNGQKIKGVLIVGRHPGLPPESKYDEKRGIKFEPIPGRKLIGIPGAAPDLAEILGCLKEHVPHAF